MTGSMTHQGQIGWKVMASASRTRRPAPGRTARRSPAGVSARSDHGRRGRALNGGWPPLPGLCGRCPPRLPGCPAGSRPRRWLRQRPAAGRRAVRGPSRSRSRRGSGRRRGRPVSLASTAACSRVKIGSPERKLSVARTTDRERVAAVPAVPAWRTAVGCRGSSARRWPARRRSARSRAPFQVPSRKPELPGSPSKASLATFSCSWT